MARLPVSVRLMHLLLATLVGVAADQWTKIWIQKLSQEGRLPLRLTPFLDLILTRNRGVSFGLLSAGSDMQIFLLLGIAITISLFVVTWYFKARDTDLRMGLLMIFAGAMGNLVDRSLIGSVVDFVFFHYGSWSFPAFNLADTLITCGAALVFWTQIREKS